MELLINIILFLLGLIILMLGANWLIQSSVKLANLLRLTPFFIALIFIAIGTSAPEAGVSIIAAIKNQKGIALGNIIGSNIANIGFVLGLCGLFKSIKIQKHIFKSELPVFVITPVLLLVFSLDLKIGRYEGIVFIIIFLLFFYLSYRKQNHFFNEEELSTFKFSFIFKKINSKLLIFLLALLFVLFIVYGANLMVKAGIKIAYQFNISGLIIGITAFAFGTSLPELITSLSAMFKKVPSISSGNIIGSNIINILLILGVVALIHPIKLSAHVLKFELFLIFLSSLLFIFMRTKYVLSRIESAILFICYIVFLALLKFV